MIIYCTIVIYFNKKLQDTSEDDSAESKYFKIGDYVDIKVNHIGSWFMAKLIKIKKDFSSISESDDNKSASENDGLLYVVE